MRTPAVLLLALAACTGESRPKTPFDGAAAFGYVRTQLAFGFRIPGTEGHRRTGDWIVARMRAAADTVIEQRFTHVTVKGDTLPLRNILARFRPGDPQRVLYVTHWDSRPVSDQAPDPAQRTLPMPGANDGASGVAMFVALAEALKKTPPTMGVDLLFVDGEDYGSFDDGKDVLLGSRWFAAHPPETGYRPLYGVLWDMIGKHDTRFPQEQFSVQRAPEVVSLVWKKAASLGYQGTFLPTVGLAITDDHIPLLDAGMHVIDVIDYDYPEHHTPADTLGRVSQRSLQISGDVAFSLLHD
ncbi:MAG TPA: M28 family peptidase [Gemmatimonadaceae bacterium]|nr:M28 family peptidase [Gemmatimonadaceae bacterium]